MIIYLVSIASLLYLWCSPVHAYQLNNQQQIQAIQELWNEGQVGLALTTVDEAIVQAPKDIKLHHLRGDLLMLHRQHAEALQSYDQAISLAPKDFNAYWAKWSLFTKLKQPHEAIHVLEHLASQDPTNPLLFLRLANSLRRVDRLEDAIPAYERAITLAPEQLRWQLALARTLFDVLQTEEAQQIVHHVIQEAAPGSSELAGAKRLLEVVEGKTTDKGRRSKPFEATREGAEKNHQWALTRETAWALMRHGEWARAEQAWRKVITIKPRDHRAFYDLGKTLMRMEDWDSAREELSRSISHSPDGDIYPDAIFRIGQCLAKLGEWDEARKNFERVLAIEHWQSEATYSMTFPSIKDVATARDQAVAQATRLEQLTSEPLLLPTREEPPTVEITQATFNADSPSSQPAVLPHRDATIGRDSLRAWFSHVIPAKGVERDDLQTGTHEFLPLNPHDTFSTTDEEIFLVFGVLLPSYDAVQLTAQYVHQREAVGIPQAPLGQDSVALTNNEQSGYFILPRPEQGWRIGIYRVDLFMHDVSSANHVDEIWFRVIEQPFQN